MKMRFNRYIVECKYNGQCVLTNQVTDLIDTQWNVNIRRRIKRAKIHIDLIDTQWNVNARTSAGDRNL